MQSLKHAKLICAYPKTPIALSPNSSSVFNYNNKLIYISFNMWVKIYLENYFFMFQWIIDFEEVEVNKHLLIISLIE
jgi:hypothetical protein